MPYKSNLAAVGRALHHARVKGMEAAAQQIINRVQDGLRGGYTTGQWVTGTNTSSVVRTAPMRLRGIWTILIGTSLHDPPYPLFWELGFNQRQVVWKDKKGRWVSPKYIKRGKELVLNPTKFVRKEVWAPALRNGADDAQRAFTRVFRKTLKASGVLAMADEMRHMDTAAD